MKKLRGMVYIDSKRVESYLRTLLAGMLPAMALLFGQWLVYGTKSLLIASIIGVMLFVILSCLYLIKRCSGLPTLIETKNW